MDFDAAFAEPAAQLDASADAGTGGMGGDASVEGASGKGGAAGGSGGDSGAGGSATGGTGQGGSAEGGMGGAPEAGPQCPVKSVQGGSATLSGTQVSTSISPVDMTHSFLTFGIAFDGGNPGTSQVAGQLVAADTVQFERSQGDTTVPIAIRWYVAEFASCALVQRGVTALNAAYTDVTLATAVDLGRSFPLVSAVIPGNTYNNDDGFRARIETPTTLRINGESLTGGTLAWQVVSLDFASVQSGDVSMSSAATTAAAQLASVDLDRTWLLHSYQYGGSGTPAAAALLVTGRFSSATDLSFERAQSGAPIELTWYAVSLNNGARVIRQSEVLSGTSATHDALGVKAEHSIATTGGYFYRGGATPFANNSLGVGSVTLDLASGTLGTTLSISRGATDSPVTVDWSVVEFP
jgi:hypothetical protein